MAMLRRLLSLSLFTLFKDLLLTNHCTNQSQILYVLSLGRGTKVCINGPGHMTKMAAMPIYGKNLKKSSSLNRWTDFNETWYAALRTLGPTIICMNHDLELTLTYFTTRSTLVTLAFQWTKMKTLDFSGSFFSL